MGANNNEEPVEETDNGVNAGPDGAGGGGGSRGEHDGSIRDGSNHVDVVGHMVPKNVPWESLKVNREDESIVHQIDDIKDACYFLMPDWKVCTIPDVLPFSHKLNLSIGRKIPL